MSGPGEHQISANLADLAQSQRDELNARLTTEAITSSWSGFHLTVDEAYEQRVTSMIEQVRHAPPQPSGGRQTSGGPPAMSATPGAAGSWSPPLPGSPPSTTGIYIPPAFPGVAGPSGDYGTADYGTAGYGTPGNGPPGYGPPGAAGPPGYAPAGYGTPGYGTPEYGPPGFGPPGYGPSGYGTPGYAPTGYSGYGPPGYGYAPYRNTNSRASTSMIFGIVSLAMIFVCAYLSPFMIPLAVLAIVKARQAKREIADSNGMQTGLGQAKAGEILGWVYVGLLAAGVILIAVVLIVSASSGSGVR